MLAGKNLAKDFPMLGLGRASVAGGATLESGDQVVIQVASNLKYDELMRVLGVCTHQTIGGDPKNRLTKLSLVDEGKP